MSLLRCFDFLIGSHCSTGSDCPLWQNCRMQVFVTDAGSRSSFLSNCASVQGRDHQKAIWGGSLEPKGSAPGRANQNIFLDPTWRTSRECRYLTCVRVTELWGEGHVVYGHVPSPGAVKGHFKDQLTAHTQEEAAPCFVVVTSLDRTVLPDVTRVTKLVQVTQASFHRQTERERLTCKGCGALMSTPTRVQPTVVYTSGLHTSS